MRFFTRVPQALSTPLFAETEDKAAESAFLPIADDVEVADAAFAKAESLGRGSAKVRNAKLTWNRDRYADFTIYCIN